MTKTKARLVINKLSTRYDNKPELTFNSHYQLLVAVILSAQCTDKRVNQITKVLFEVANTPEQMIKLTNEQLEKIIFSCGLYKSKAAHILSASHDIVHKFNGVVPTEFEKLLTLAGVGRKTANVVCSVTGSKDAIAVDTHVFRVSRRIGLANAKTVFGVEMQLMKIIDKSLWNNAHHYLIYHGRAVCKAQGFNCSTCFINDLCEKNLNLTEKGKKNVQNNKKSI